MSPPLSLSSPLSLLSSFFAFNLLISTTSAVYISDNGCPCSNAQNGSITGGCRRRTVGFDGVTPSVTWCLTDQVKSPGCGTLSGYGYADTCANAGFASVTVLPNQALLEPGQDQWTFYTGQSINLTWSSQLLENNERVVFSVYTPTLRSIPVNFLGNSYFNVTLGSATNLKLTESTSTPLATTGGPSPVVILNAGSNSVNAQSEVRSKNSTQLITILQSKMISVEAYWKNTLLTATTTVPFDDQTFTVRWSAIGMADFGTATISIQRCGGGGGGGSTVCSQTSPTTGSSFGSAVQVQVGSFSTTSYEANITMSRLTTNNQNIGSNYQILVSVPVPGAFGGGGGGTVTAYTYGSIGFVLGLGLQLLLP